MARAGVRQPGLQPLGHAGRPVLADQSADQRTRAGTDRALHELGLRYLRALDCRGRVWRVRAPAQPAFPPRLSTPPRTARARKHDRWPLRVTVVLVALSLFRPFT